MSRGDARRQVIVDALRSSDRPVSGAALGRICGVSRQVVVQDIALLRSQGTHIVSTNRGYVLGPASARPRRLFKCRHTVDETAEELLCVIDLGGRVEDVFVNHRIYGLISSKLEIACRRDVELFMEGLSTGRSAPLMMITSGYHFHHVSAADEKTLDLIGAALDEHGFLAPLTDYEREAL